jgi:hypothetical protein
MPTRVIKGAYRDVVRRANLLENLRRKVEHIQINLKLEE